MIVFWDCESKKCVAICLNHEGKIAFASNIKIVKGDMQNDSEMQFLWRCIKIRCRASNDGV